MPFVVGMSSWLLAWGLCASAHAQAEPGSAGESNARTGEGQTGQPLTQDPQVDVEVTVDAEDRARNAKATSASEYVVEREVIAAAPRSEGADVLRLAPGLYMGRGEGASIAPNYSLRGFDSEHGQDIEFSVGGIPINLPAHIHGQGYSDLGFLIGDVVQRLNVIEGVYDPSQGDFAVAGSIGIELGVEPEDRGLSLSGGYGSWGRWSHQLLWAPKESSAQSFGALRYTQSRGFGQNRAYKVVSAILQHQFVTENWSHRVLAIVHGSRANHAGVLRREDVEQGKIGFLDVYPYPTARAQNAFAQRLILGLSSDYRSNSDARGQVGAWVSLDNFRLQRNFTGFIEQSRVLNRVGGRGDLIEQRNKTLSVGISGRYKSVAFKPAAWLSAKLHAGIQGRIDNIEQEQSLLDATVRSQTWDHRVEAGVRGLDLGGWADVQTRLGSQVKLAAGVRANVLSYEIDDKLGNLAPNTRPKDQFIVGFRRSALGMSLGPRASLQYTPLRGLSFSAAYGQGYRSPQARILSDGEDAPYTTVQSADLGVRYRLGRKLSLSASGYYTHLSDDVAFEASEGRLERLGESQRLGAAFSAQGNPAPWMVASLSATFVHATLLEPPPPTATEPLPPFQKGQHLPFVPPVVLRADVGLRHALLARDTKNELVGRAGLGASFLSPRPLPFQDFAEPVGLLDLSVGLDWRNLSLNAEFLNVLDARYAAVEYSFASDWDPKDGVRPRTPVRHGSAGAPFSWFLGLELRL